MRKLRTVLGSVLLAVALMIVAMAAPVVADRGNDDDRQNREASVRSTRNGQIVFRRYFNAEQTKGALFVMNPDGSDVRQITHPPRGWRDNVPAWSPDGKRIAFERFKTDDSTSRVMVVNPDTGRHARRRAMHGGAMRVCHRSLLLTRQPVHRLRPHGRPAQRAGSAGVAALLGDLRRGGGRERCPPGQQHSAAPPRTATSVRHHRPDVLARRQDARLPAHSLPPGGEHCRLRAADRLAEDAHRITPWRHELSGPPDVLPRRQAAAVPLHARGRGGSLQPLLGPPRRHGPSSDHPRAGRQAVPRLQLLADLPQGTGMDHGGTHRRLR